MILGSPKASPQSCPWQICKTWRQPGGLLGALLIIGDGQKGAAFYYESWDQVLLTRTQSMDNRHFLCCLGYSMTLIHPGCLKRQRTSGATYFEKDYGLAMLTVIMAPLLVADNILHTKTYYGQHGACYNLVASVHKGHFRHPTPSRPEHFAKNCRQQF